MKKSAVVLVGMLGGLIGFMVGSRQKNNGTSKDDKYRSYYNVLTQWLTLKQENKTLVKYFTDNQYNVIAIYGMGELGNRLYEELKSSNIRVEYAIDINAGTTFAEIEVKGLEDQLEEVDAIIVTSTFAFDEVKKNLSGLVDFPIVSLEEVVYSI